MRSRFDMHVFHYYFQTDWLWAVAIISCIFMTRTNQTIFKNNIEMKKEWNESGQWFFLCLWGNRYGPKVSFSYRGYNAPTQISKYIRGFYSAGSVVISKIGTQYGSRSCFPYHYNQTTLMAHSVRHLRPRLELCDFCPGNKTVHLTQYNTISYNGNFCRLLSL